MSDKDLEQLAVNTIRMLAADMVEQANSGHPGMPLGAAPMAYLLWTRFMHYNPPIPCGPTGTASYSARGTARPFSTPCCT